ncbi:hypothetical protein CLAIMM_13830 [Cladophialophora immunda]|nr:hypothetical protein CLAIMM_13830 [Cladophialophora immunda]
MSSSVIFPPTTVPERTVSFLKKFFHLLDDETLEGAEAFGHLFTEEATYHLSPVLVYRGRPALIEQRIWAWKTWPRMTHYINGIYGSDPEGLKVVVVGGYGAPVPDGKDVTGPSAAVYELVDHDGCLLISRLEILSDPAPLASLIKG